MSPQQVEVIRRTFARLAAAPDVTAFAFYRNLFTLAPEVRRLFHTDIALQSRKLMQMLQTIVDGLDQPAALSVTLEELGARHAGYGVQPVHYSQVGMALLQTLDQTLGPECTPEVREAWGAVHGWISETMQSGACAAVPTPRGSPIPG